MFNVQCYRAPTDNDKSFGNWLAKDWKRCGLDTLTIPMTTEQQGNEFTFTFTIPEMGSYTFVVGNAAGSQSFVAGNKYKYTVLINRTGLTITSTIEDWGAGNGENGENIVAE